MKALNHKEITNKYLIFLSYFTILIAFTVFCCFLFLKTGEQQSKIIIEKKQSHDFIFQKRRELADKIDTLNNYLIILNTEQVENEIALERKILKLKTEASKQLDALKADGDAPYILYDKIISNVEKAIDNKRLLHQAMADEEIHKMKLMDCIEANKKAKKALTQRN